MIYVPTPELDSPARRALEMEGLECQEWLCNDDYKYGRLWERLWGAGEEFVIVEWDVIPWPGAVTRMLECPASWCTYRYPLHRGNLTTSFGIGKYRPPGPEFVDFSSSKWQALDGQVIPYLRQKLGAPCIHEPAVAHARRRTPGGWSE